MKKANKKINAAIVVIGNEILSGRTQDVNVVTMSKWLNKLGVKLDEVRVIPDIQDSIVKTINEVRKKFNYIFTTGGIGPTHDDITSKAIAKAFSLKYGKHKQAYKLLEDYYGSKNFTSLLILLNLVSNFIFFSSKDFNIILLVRWVFMPTIFLFISIIWRVYFNFLFGLSDTENQASLPLFSNPIIDPELGQ